MRFLSSVAAVAALATTSTALDPLGPLAPRTGKVSYDGYHVYRVRAESVAEVEAIEARLAPSFHTIHGRDSLDVAVGPHQLRHFEEMGFLEARLLSDDLGRQIREEARAPTYRRRDNVERGDDDLPDLSWFDTYHDYEDHLVFWDDLFSAVPKNYEKRYLGPSYEGRDIHAYHLWGDGGKSEEKPIILWHGTVHAREWISTAVVEYLAYQLVDGYKSGDKNVTSFLDHYDFWIVPFHNPDGFVYSQTDDRLWRKNRQPRQNETCVGTDNNRNWEYKWEFEPEEGSVSPDPCSQSFKGLSGGDTPENQAVSALSTELAATGGGIRSFIDWHSYSQLILTPWGWSCDEEDLPDTLDRMVEVGEGVAAAIRENSGEEYVVGPACEVLYFSTGTGRDHHHGELNATHSWTLELRPASPEEGGFVLPPEEIWPTVKEQWAGQLWMLNEVWED